MDVARFYEAHTHINMRVLNTVSNFQMNHNFQRLWSVYPFMSHQPFIKFSSTKGSYNPVSLCVITC